MNETIEILSEMRAGFNCLDPEEEPKYRALSEAISAVSAPVKLTNDEAESLMDWLDTNFIESIKADPDCDNMEWLCNMVSIYKKCKEVVENGRTM